MPPDSPHLCALRVPCPSDLTRQPLQLRRPQRLVPTPRPLSSPGSLPSAWLGRRARGAPARVCVTLAAPPLRSAPEPAPPLPPLPTGALLRPPAWPGQASQAQAPEGVRSATPHSLRRPPGPALAKRPAPLLAPALWLVQSRPLFAIPPPLPAAQAPAAAPMTRRAESGPVQPQAVRDPQVVPPPPPLRRPGSVGYAGLCPCG
mmetsp:Transcript_22845/g.71689  ORF Transcript_22845/g.71689 Transcript_22845/m.71689 type:complete len:203 (-) Transcript_22845:945-1553(-)